MTSYEIETASALGRADAGNPIWSTVLVPLLAAALVIALGLVLVGVTSQDEAGALPPTGPTAASVSSP